MSGQSIQWQATARLLRRTGFGASGPQIDAVTTQDWSVHLDAVLGLDPDLDPGARSTPLPTPITPPTGGLSGAELKALDTELTRQMKDLTTWWIRRMVAVEEPIHEKLTLVWHDHFATSAQKVPFAVWMAAQNQKLRTLKLGDFRTLAFAMLSDAAMLYWLDGFSNNAKSANENLSREFMELFALGHGNGYSELDVREGARALTGWSIGPGGQTEVNWDEHDANVKTILGYTGNLDHNSFCDVVLSQPQSAAFVAGRLWRQLASDTLPSAEAMDRLVGAYGSSRDLKALTKAILLDPEFVSSTGSIVTAPIEWMVGVIRSLKVSVDDPPLLDAIMLALAMMQQRPFFPPNVNGWPHGQAWLSTTATAARVWAANRFVTLGDLSTVEEAAKGDRLDAAGYLIGVGAWTDRTANALKLLVDDPKRIVAAAVNTPEYLTA